MNTIVEGIATSFAYHKDLAERAMAQVPEERLHSALHEETNSIAVIVKHVAGNLRSRWTDFLMSDGEKAWRDRDEEFRDTFGSRAEMMMEWERGWKSLMKTLAGLSDEDLKKEIVIRGEKLSVPTALARSLGHTAYHVGQIVQIARVMAGREWKTLTIARGGSKSHNQRVWGQEQYGGGSSEKAAPPSLGQ